MTHAKLEGGAIAQYPYTINDLKADYVGSSFPKNSLGGLMWPTDLETFNVVEVAASTPPTPSATQDVIELTPIQVNGVWTRQWSLRDWTQAEIEANTASRIAEAKSIIDAERDAAIASGVAYNGHTWHTDNTFLLELLGMILGYQAGMYTGTQSIRTRENTVEQLDVTAIMTLAGLVGAHRKATYATSWAAKDALYQ